MAKRDKAAEALDRAVALRKEPDAAALVAGLRELIAGKYAAAVAKAATIAREREVCDQLAVELAGAFDHFLDHADPGCAVKTAAVQADVLDVERLLIAIRHVQMEGSFGPPVDVAAAMRGHAAMGLLNARYADALRTIEPLLADADQRGALTDARRGAIRALGTVISETSAIMLRMTARRFARDPETLAEALSSLNAIEPGRSVAFIAAFLESADADTIDTAALALAEGRQSPGFDALLAGWPRRSAMPDDARPYLTALAMTRRPAAIDALIAEVEQSPRPRVLEALSALELFRGDAAICARVRTAADGRRDRAIAEAAEAFDAR